ncbi:MAG: histidine ammonia-lyase [Xanthobacteraceae bacterium]
MLIAIMSTPVVVTPGDLTLSALREIHRGTAVPRLTPASRPAVAAAEATIAAMIGSEKKIYGLNTGFGKLANRVIPPNQINALQNNLVLSHSAGVGALLDDATVRLVLTLKLASLARGHSGVRWELIDALQRLLERGVYPCIPAKGSVGASGDLAPLAHLSATLLGVGQMRYRDRVIGAAEGLALAELTPLQLGPNEGLALVNGTQVSTALALIGLFAAEDIFAAAVVAGALSVEAAKGSHEPFDSRIHAVRGQRGQSAVASVYRDLLERGASSPPRSYGSRVQDPYSLRCQPQVMGACLDHIRFAADIFGREANAVSGNPIVFPETGDIVSGGNFHAEPIGMAADCLALAIAEIGALAERRIALLIDENISGLPSFLVHDAGLNSGFMVAHVTAAALASENKSLAHPASVDSIPTSANQEDHVSMSTYAARRLSDMANNTAQIVAIELLAACQGLEFHLPLEASSTLRGAKEIVRARVSAYDRDRYLSPDMETAASLVCSGVFNQFMPKDLLPSLRGTSP